MLTKNNLLATPATKKKIDKQRLNELDSSTLVELIKDYMLENQDLRRENTDLFSVRDMMLRYLKLLQDQVAYSGFFSETKSLYAERMSDF